MISLKKVHIDWFFPDFPLFGKGFVRGFDEGDEVSEGNRFAVVQALG